MQISVKTPTETPSPENRKINDAFVVDPFHLIIKEKKTSDQQVLFAEISFPSSYRLSEVVEELPISVKLRILGQPSTLNYRENFARSLTEDEISFHSCSYSEWNKTCAKKIGQC